MATNDYADSNRGRVSYALETTFDTYNAGSPPAMQILRVTQSDFVAKKSTVVSNEIRATRDVATMAMVGGNSDGSFTYELSGGGAFDDFIQAALGGTYGTATAVTSVSATASTNVFAATGIDTNVTVGQNILAYGFVNAANNGWFRVTAKTTGQITVAGTLVTESATVSTGVKAKTLTNGVVKRSFAVEEAFTDVGQYFLYTGQRIGTMTLTAKAGQLVTGTFAFVGATSQNKTSGFASGYTAASSAQIMNATTNVGSVLEGSSLTALTTGIEEFTLNLDNALRPQMAVGSRYPKNIGYGRQTITGTINAYFYDTTLYAKFLNHTATSLVFSFTDGVGGGVRIYLPKVYFSTDDPALGGIDQDVMEKIAFTAVYDPTVGSQIVIDIA